LLLTPLRFFRKAVVLAFSAFFAMLLHGFAQSVITTYVGPQLPVSGSLSLTQPIDSPWGLATDLAGGLYIASNHQNRVYAVTPDGVLLLAAGSSYGFGGDGGPATEARLA